MIRASLVGTLAVVLLVLVDLSAKGGNPVGLVQPGARGPSVSVFTEDFPQLELPRGLGHDGQQFYAIARQPTDLDALEGQLDRPQYRLQRPLFPGLAWALHPSGGGYGLVYAFFAVGVVSVFALGVAAGGLSAHLGGGTWPALLAPVLPGSYAALRMTLADTLALALALGALLLAERRRSAGAGVAAVLGVLAKESMLVLLIGHAVSRRTRASVVAAMSATVVSGVWWVALRLAVEADEGQVLEFTWPLGGVFLSLDDWVTGKDWIAGATVLGSLVLAAVALRLRGRTHPLAGALAASAAFMAFLGPDVLGLDFNGTRMAQPVLLLAIIVLGTPGRAADPKPVEGAHAGTSPADARSAS